METNNEIFVLEGITLVPKIFKLAMILLGFTCLVILFFGSSGDFISNYILSYSSNTKEYISDKDESTVSFSYANYRYKKYNNKKNHQRILQELAYKDSKHQNLSFSPKSPGYKDLSINDKDANNDQSAISNSNSISIEEISENKTLENIINTHIFYKALSQNVYIGNWSIVNKEVLLQSNNPIKTFSHNKGVVKMAFERNIFYNLKQIDPLAANMRFTDGSNIDKWIHFMVFGLFNNNTEFNNEDKSLYEKNIFNYITLGEIFERLEDDKSNIYFLIIINFFLHRIANEYQL